MYMYKILDFDSFYLPCFWCIQIHYGCQLCFYKYRPFIGLFSRLALSLPEQNKNNVAIYFLNLQILKEMELSFTERSVMELFRSSLEKLADSIIHLLKNSTMGSASSLHKEYDALIQEGIEGDKMKGQLHLWNIRIGILKRYNILLAISFHAIFAIHTI